MPLPKVPDGAQPDLTLKAVKTQRFVCRVNDHFNNCAFSEWVKVKVLDTNKSGKRDILARRLFKMLSSVYILVFRWAHQTINPFYCKFIASHFKFLLRFI